MDTVIHNPTDGIYAATDDDLHALEVRKPAGMADDWLVELEIIAVA